MLKKVIYVGGGAALLTALIFGRDAYSYVSTTVASVHESVKSSVPIDFEIDRARKMIADLKGPIAENKRLIATEKVAIERLEERVTKLDAKQTKARGHIMQMKAGLDDGKGYVHLAGHRYSSQEVEADLTRRFERFKTSDSTLVSLRKVLNARTSSLNAAEQKLEGMFAAKRQLEVDVENLEARQKMVEVAQTTSDFNFDNSHLARTKELITDIQTRIEVSEQLLDADSDFAYEIPMDEPESSSVTDDITSYFGDEEESVEELASLSDFN